MKLTYFTIFVLIKMRSSHRMSRDSLQKGAKANNAQERGKDRAAKVEGGITGRMRGRGGQKKEEEGKEGRKHR